ncbi:MAG: hypothetical protein DI585_06285 [Pseudomonas fluorescens]|nr:MAG: hypothetical protein DI585_06285 [Pseudomonas fluorescens]
MKNEKHFALPYSALFFMAAALLALPLIAHAQNTFGSSGVSSTNGYFSGKVGIGATPNYSLAIADTSNTTVHVHGTTSGVRGGMSADTPSNGAFYMGSYANFPLAIGTNNAERLRVLTNGNVGIGITDPSERLDIGTGNISMGWETITNTCSGGGGLGCSATCSGTKRVTGGGCDVITVAGGTIAVQNASPGTNVYNCYFSGPYTSASVRAYAICANIR